MTLDAKVGDSVLCRFNAPIIKEAYGFIAKGVPARVEGREIGEGLKKLARRWKSKSFAVLLDNLDKYLEREVAKAEAKEQTNKVTAIEDSVSCLKIIINRVQQAGLTGDPVVLVSTEVDKIFGEDAEKTPHVLLSTIHKSKGREWHRVFWLQTGPSKRAKLPWELEQEQNLAYVACTRAKHELILVEMPTV
jgi:superfamily I DNA/RNA helicase